MRSVLLVCLGLLAAPVVSAQSIWDGWSLVAIETHLIGAQGDLDGPDYTRFVEGSRDATLFRVPPAAATPLLHQPRHETAGIEFRFRFRHPGRPGWTAWGGFGRSETVIDLYRIATDTDTVRIESQVQFFDVGMGADRLFRADKRLSFRVGGHLTAGPATGGRVHQGNHRLFTGSGSTWRFGAVLAARVRITSGFGMSLGIQPGRWRTHIDGSVFTGDSGTTTLALEWRL
jgi:hypothetical protein